MLKKKKKRTCQSLLGRIYKGWKVSLLCLRPVHQDKPGHFISVTGSLSRAHHVFKTLEHTMLIGMVVIASRIRAIYLGTVFLLAPSPFWVHSLKEHFLYRWHPARFEERPESFLHPALCSHS